MAIDAEYWEEDNVFRKLYIPLHWLILPFVYIHINEFLYKNALKSTSTYILIGTFFIVSFIHIVHFFLLTRTQEIAELPDHYDHSLLLFTDILSFAFNGIVLFFLVKKMNMYLENSKHTSKLAKKKIQTYKRIIVLATICISLGAVTLGIIAASDIDPTFMIYPFFILLSSCIYWVGYVGVNKVEFGRSADEKERTGSSTGAVMFGKVQQYITSEAHYLNSEISLETIAGKFGITPGYLSKLINQHTNSHFNDYINQQRVEAAKKMMLDSEFFHYTIESIGLESGFKSKSNFYTSFKKFTGQTPNQFRKQKKKS